MDLGTNNKKDISVSNWVAAAFLTDKLSEIDINYNNSPLTQTSKINTSYKFITDQFPKRGLEFQGYERFNGRNNLLIAVGTKDKLGNVLKNTEAEVFGVHNRDTGTTSFVTRETAENLKDDSEQSRKTREKIREAIQGDSLSSSIQNIDSSGDSKKGDNKETKKQNSRDTLTRISVNPNHEATPQNQNEASNKIESSSIEPREEINPTDTSKINNYSTTQSQIVGSQNNSFQTLDNIQNQSSLGNIGTQSINNTTDTTSSSTPVIPNQSHNGPNNFQLGSSSGNSNTSRKTFGGSLTKNVGVVASRAPRVIGNEFKDALGSNGSKDKRNEEKKDNGFKYSLPGSANNLGSINNISRDSEGEVLGSDDEDDLSQRSNKEVDSETSSNTPDSGQLNKARKFLDLKKKFAKLGGIKSFLGKLLLNPWVIGIIIFLLLILIIVVIVIPAVTSATNQTVENENTKGASSAFFQYFGVASGTGDSVRNMIGENPVRFDDLGNIREINFRFGFKLNKQDVYMKSFGMPEGSSLRVNDMYLCADINLPSGYEPTIDVTYSNFLTKSTEWINFINPNGSKTPISISPYKLSIENDNKKICWQPIVCYSIFSSGTCSSLFEDNVLIKIKYEKKAPNVTDFTDNGGRLEVKFGGQLMLTSIDRAKVENTASFDIAPPIDKCLSMEQDNTLGTFFQCSHPDVQIVNDEGGTTNGNQNGGPDSGQGATSGQCPFKFQQNDILHCNNGFFSAHKGIDWMVKTSTGIPQTGNGVVSPIKGTITAIWPGEQAGRDICGWGVEIRQPGPNTRYYLGHLEPIPGKPLVVGREVEIGEELGTYFARKNPDGSYRYGAWQGFNPCWTGPHVHMDINYGDPYDFVKSACIVGDRKPIVNDQLFCQ